MPMRPGVFTAFDDSHDIHGPFVTAFPIQSAGTAFLIQL